MFKLHETASFGGVDFKAALLNTLDIVGRVEAGEELGEPHFVTTSKGAVEVLPTTVEAIRKDIEKNWGEVYPSLVEENWGLPDGFVRFVKRIGLLPLKKEIKIVHADE